MSEPSAVTSDAQEQPCSQPDQAFAAGLAVRGHRLLTRAGKLFVSNASQLSDDEKQFIKDNRDVLLPFAEAWQEESVPTSDIRIETRKRSVLDFVSRTQSSQPNWQAQEPPNLSAAKNIIVNFETNGLNWHKGDAPIGATVGTLDGQVSRFLPWGFNGGNLPKENIIRYLKDIKGKHITNANMGFDIHMGNVEGVDFEAQGNTVSDIMHTAALLDDHRKRFALDVLAKDYLGGIEIPRIDESNMSAYPAYEVAERAEYQATLVAKLHEMMWPEVVKQDLERVHKLEDEVIYPVCEIERNGVRIDTELLEQYKKECDKRYNKLIFEISDEVGFGFDCTNKSWERVFQKYRLPITYLKTGKKHGPSFTEEVLTEFDHPIIKKGLLAKQLASLDSKVFTPYLQNIIDGFLYFNLVQLKSDDKGTVSGRFAAPYVQQVPNHDNHFATFGDDLYPRHLYIPSLPEYDYLEADAAQVEYRIFAHFANNQTVLDGYAKDPEMSFHKMVWKMMLEFKPDMTYTRQKTMNFMKLYGGGVFKLAWMMGFITKAEMEDFKARKDYKNPKLEEAYKIIQVYKDVLPEADWLLKMAAHLGASRCDDHCNENEDSIKLHKLYPHRGYVCTLMGRRARFPDNWSLHKAFNRVDQGTGADIMKLKMIELHRERKYTGFKMRATVHDSLMGDAMTHETKVRVKEILNRQSLQLRVPILWDVNTASSWAKCK